MAGKEAQNTGLAGEVTGTGMSQELCHSLLTFAASTLNETGSHWGL